MMTLSGKKFLVTRSTHQAGDFVHAIEQNGGTAILFPTIEIVPPASWDACDKAIGNIYMYNGLIFTSVNGVEFFFRRMRERDGRSNNLKSKLIFVVGEKTQQAVEHHGLNVTLMPDKFTAADLARKLQSEDLHGKTFLFPRGNLGKDVLQDDLKLLGASVDSVIVYQTVKPQQDKVEEVRAMLLNGEIDVATFTSPSTFNNFTALFSKQDLIDVCEKTKIAVIGPVTEKAVRAANLNAHITARQSTIESLLEAIIAYFTSTIRNPHSAIKT
jgi:uroporphyrinogen III methyltransferase/synthase